MRWRKLLFVLFYLPLHIHAQTDSAKTSIRYIRVPAKDSLLPVKESILKQLQAVATNNKRQSGEVRLLLSLKNKTDGEIICRWLASRDKKNLLQVNMSGLTSKYIGETEKNLSEVFTSSNAINTILFFDEADALFDKRGSTAEESNDQEKAISYFIKQLAAHKGTVVVLCAREDCNQRLSKARLTPVSG